MIAISFPFTLADIFVAIVPPLIGASPNPSEGGALYSDFSITVIFIDQL